MGGFSDNINYAYGAGDIRLLTMIDVFRESINGKSGPIITLMRADFNRLNETYGRICNERRNTYKPHLARRIFFGYKFYKPLGGTFSLI